MYRLPDLSFLQPVLDAAIEVDQAEAGSTQVYRAERQELRIVAHRGLTARFIEHFEVVTAGDGSACGHALADRRRIVIRDMETDHAFAPHREVAMDAGLRSVVSTPLIGRNGALVGVLSTHRSRPRPTEGAAPRTDVLVLLAAAIVECGHLRARIEERARERQSELPLLSPAAQHGALASRELLALLRERGMSPEIAEAAARELERLLPELRLLAQTW